MQTQWNTKAVRKAKQHQNSQRSCALPVFAIIGVLVAISIPIFTSQLEKAREATDLANIRSAYAECSTAVLLESKDNVNGVKYEGGAASKNVTLVQQKNGWQTSDSANKDIAGKKLSQIPTSGEVTVTVKADGTWECATKKSGS